MEVTLGSSIGGTPAQLFHQEISVRREHDDRYRRHPRSEDPRRVNAIHERHREIENYEIGMQLLSFFNCL